MTGCRHHAHDILPRRARLKSGHEVEIRPVEERDGALIRDGFAHLSDQSRFMRFLATRGALSDAELARLTDAGDDDSLALGAVTQPDTTPVGLARFIRLDPAGPDAEMALTVVDAFQGQGAGRVLLETLAQAARGCGVTAFIALVHRDNHAMLGLLHSYGAVVEQGMAVDLELRLPLSSVPAI
ncbi:GNAT family N-acetyltransferase [uncultured Tateyamaria sp.]|uniref:GNAT family N-acetyltransferase n=1 Tax=uncultured Tateyamaria sp. TaxID=455651 RepID=UPI00261E93FE|nr:GNAT family N-acetyltransferase [uncultured Tateyamaria sp.]